MNNTLFFTVAFALALSPFVSSPLQAHDVNTPAINAVAQTTNSTTNATAPSLAINITQPYAYATTSVQKNGAVFLRLNNQSAQGDTLTKAAADIAERVELHTHAMDGGIMMMRQVEGYDIPARSDITLKPAGHHIMLMNLKAPLKAGERFPLTLSFTHAPERVIDVEILPPGTKPEAVSNAQTEVEAEAKTKIETNTKTKVQP